MKDKRLIFYCEPCTVRLNDPAVQSLEDVRSRAETPCPHYPARTQCSPPRYGCIALAGAKMARYVLQFYSEATEQTLALEADRFAREAPLPLDQVEGYIDAPEEGFRVVADPVVVVERVREYARGVLDLKPGERVFRSTEETVEPPPGSEKEAPQPSRQRQATGAA